MKKAGRNDPCPCGSGKKFKKCCEPKMQPHRLSASRITSINSLQKMAGLTSLFQNRLAELSAPKSPVQPPASETEPVPLQADLEEKGNLLITS